MIYFAGIYASPDPGKLNWINQWLKWIYGYNHQMSISIWLTFWWCGVTTTCNNSLPPLIAQIQYIPRNMHTVFALLCFVVVIHWLIFPYPSGLLHWHCGNLTIAPVPAKQPWWIWINTSCEFIMNDCITTTKQSTTKPCAYFLGYTVIDYYLMASNHILNQCWHQSHCNFTQDAQDMPTELSFKSKF